MTDQGFGLGFVPFYFVSNTLVEMYQDFTIALALLKCEFLYERNT